MSFANLLERNMAVVAAIQQVYTDYPGLVDGETPVDGADLTQSLTNLGEDLKRWGVL